MHSNERKKLVGLFLHFKQVLKPTGERTPTVQAHAEMFCVCPWSSDLSAALKQLGAGRAFWLMGHVDKHSTHTMMLRKLPHHPEHCGIKLIGITDGLKWQNFHLDFEPSLPNSEECSEPKFWTGSNLCKVEAFEKYGGRMRFGFQPPPKFTGVLVQTCL